MQALTLNRGQQREINFLARSRKLTTLERLVLEILVETCQYYGKLYCYPSLPTILERLREWKKFPSSGRSLDRAIVRLRHLGFIRRLLRPERHPGSNKPFTSSLTFLKGRAHFLISQFARLPRALARLLPSPRMAYYTEQRENQSKVGTLFKGDPQPRQVEIRRMEASNSSYLTPEHNFPESVKDVLRKLDLW